MNSQTSSAQGSAPPARAAKTTKILAIGRVNAKGAGVVDATPAPFLAVMPREIRATAKLYLGGAIEQWFSRTDQLGVVFILNATTEQDARDLLQGLPLGRAGMMDFEFIALGPLMPLALLVTELDVP